MAIVRIRRPPHHFGRYRSHGIDIEQPGPPAESIVINGQTIETAEQLVCMYVQLGFPIRDKDGNDVTRQWLLSRRNSPPASMPT